MHLGTKRGMLEKATNAMRAELGEFNTVKKHNKNDLGTVRLCIVM